MESWFTEPKLPLGRLGQDRHHLAAGQRRRVLRRGDGGDRFPRRRLHRDSAAHAVSPRRSRRRRARLLAAPVVAPRRLRRRRLLVIANLGYWQATVETISLVGFATLTSVVIGVPVGVASAHRPWLYAFLPAAARPDADAADLRLSDPDAGAVSPRLCARPHLDRDLRHRRADPPHPPRHRLRAAAAEGGRGRVRRDKSGSSCGKWSCLTPCRRSWPASRNASC